MKKIKVFIFVYLLFMNLMPVLSQSLTIATYNLRFDNPRDTGNLWVDRATPVSNLIRFYEFDIFGTQEALKNQLDDISNALPEYSRYGVGRDDGKDAGEHSAIYFKKDRFDLVKKGDFWLSQTPDKPTLGWDATCCKRICSWVYLSDKKTKKKFYVFNAHFDHQGKVARVESAKLILQKIKEIAGNEPVVFMGDLNGSHQSEWYQNLANSDLLKDTFTQTKNPFVNQNGTFNGFNPKPQNSGVIDHIFTTKDFSVTKWGILTDSYKGKFPSDHFPVMTVLSLK
jgi:endonuclease/exonuclease/phosphatase family metal-dependent hydrolase